MKCGSAIDKLRAFPISPTWSTCGSLQVRNPLAAGVQRENSAFLSSALPVAGFAVIEAADPSEAINIVSLTPYAVGHGVVEVWPLEEA